MVPRQLFDRIRWMALELPTPTLESIVNVLNNNPGRGCSDRLTSELYQRLPKASWRQGAIQLIELWRAQAPEMDSAAMATALLTAAYCEEKHREELSVEVVWTGPSTSEVALRRTDQVLLQLIQEARQELLLISFAVYKVPDIAMALVAAIDRGVRLRIVAEMPDSSDRKVAYGASAALGDRIMGRAQLFVWPPERRPTDAEGRSGSLHVKCAIADRDRLFVSSANLTEYALALNMEMGLLVHSQDLAGQVTDHIDRLIYQKILVLE